jgi:diaminohydroxyphosphoribosylaminopyrimidine deaminase/5-amino-6-(5-phosphoribosylamino)uracil reductase
MRAESDAVLTGIGTVLADDPLLTCRLPGMAERSPVRVVLDSKLRLPLDSQVVASARQARLWVVTSESSAAERAQALRAAGAEVLPAPAGAGGLDLPVALDRLAERGITRVMVEAGPILAAAVLNADLVDEAVLLRSSKLVGVDGIDALEGLPLAALTQSHRLELIRTELAGADTIELLARR